MPDDYIVMGDIVGSRRRPGSDLMRQFAGVINECNIKLSEGLLSPCTITLGDEFQAVARSLTWSVQVALFLEEARLRGMVPFSMRYVVHLGQIDTQINPERAYGMVGAGFTRARELLDQKVRGRSRFTVELPDAVLSSQLAGLLEAMSSIARDWKEKDSVLIFDMIGCDNDAQVGSRHGMDRTQVWKRRRSLRIRDYSTLRRILLELADRGTCA